MDVTQPQTRTEAICRAIIDELRKRHASIDSAIGLVSVAITVKLQDGPNQIRAVIYEDHTLQARSSRVG